MRAPVVAGIGAAAAWCGPASAPVVPAVAAAFGIPLRLPGSGGVALTFDDGPHAEGTPATLELLCEAGARATFFLVGEQVERFPALAAEIAAAGHELALHGYRHRSLLGASPARAVGDVRRGLDAIGTAAGVRPRLYRPPYGWLNAGVLVASRRLGLAPVLWSRMACDWRCSTTPRMIVAALTTQLCGGEILVLHDADYYGEPESWRQTVRALPSLLDELDRRRLRTALLD